MEKKTYQIYKNANGKYVVTSTTEVPSFTGTPPYVHTSEIFSTPFLWRAKLKMKNLILEYESMLNEKIYVELISAYECKPMRN